MSPDVPSESLQSSSPCSQDCSDASRSDVYPLLTAAIVSTLLLSCSVIVFNWSALAGREAAPLPLSATVHSLAVATLLLAAFGLRRQRGRNLRFRALAALASVAGAVSMTLALLDFGGGSRSSVPTSV